MEDNARLLVDNAPLTVDTGPLTDDNERPTVDNESVPEDIPRLLVDNIPSIVDNERPRETMSGSTSTITRALSTMNGPRSPMDASGKPPTSPGARIYCPKHKKPPPGGRIARLILDLHAVEVIFDDLGNSG